MSELRVQLITGVYTLREMPDAATLQRIANGERVMLPARNMRGEKVMIFADQVMAWPDTVPLPPPRTEPDRSDLCLRYFDALVLAEQQLKTVPLTTAVAMASSTIRTALAVHPTRNTV